MPTVTVDSKESMMDALRSAGLTPTPIPSQHTVQIGGLTIERDVLETSFQECGHAVSTDRFSGELDHCTVCECMRTVC